MCVIGVSYARCQAGGAGSDDDKRAEAGGLSPARLGTISAQARHNLDDEGAEAGLEAGAISPPSSSPARLRAAFEAQACDEEPIRRWL